MTSNQYAELVEFLGGKFERIDHHFEQIGRRFEQVDRRFDDVDRRFDEASREREEIRDEARRHSTILFEQSQANLKVVAEGLGLHLEAIEALEGRVQVLEEKAAQG
ncbi:hypothetical protein WI460_12740 [Gemmatimonadota bacterium Y43]|uniref:hypothetical protein n=1 Tax=Gaopeijia maritima TaxID=3119007 RepID=UPI003283B85A